MDDIIRELDQDIAINQDILDSHTCCPREYHEGVIAGIGKALSLLRRTQNREAADELAKLGEKFLKDPNTGEAILDYVKSSKTPKDN